MVGASVGLHVQGSKVLGATLSMFGLLSLLGLSKYEYKFNTPPITNTILDSLGRAIMWS